MNNWPFLKEEWYLLRVNEGDRNVLLLNFYIQSFLMMAFVIWKYIKFKQKQKKKPKHTCKASLSKCDFFCLRLHGGKEISI